MSYAAAANVPGFVPPSVPLTAPTPIHPPPEQSDTAMLLERDITSQSPPPSYPLINPPTYKSSGGPPEYSARTHAYEGLPDLEGGRRRKRTGVIAQLVDWRCIGMLVAVGLFVIVCVVVIVVKQNEIKAGD